MEIGNETRHIITIQETEQKDHSNKLATKKAFKKSINIK